MDEPAPGESPGFTRRPGPSPSPAPTPDPDPSPDPDPLPSPDPAPDPDPGPAAGGPPDPGPLENCNATASGKLTEKQDPIDYSGQPVALLATHVLGEGCISTLDLTFTRLTKCPLRLQFSGMSGTWKLVGATLKSDKECGQGWGSGKTYSLDWATSSGTVKGLPELVKAPAATKSCTGLPGGMTLSGNIYMVSQSSSVNLQLNALGVTGSVLSVGGSMGTCAVAPESCEGVECGTDKYGNDCGKCASGKICHGGKCIQTCLGIECGTDQYGTNCGTCPAGNVCQGGQCVKLEACVGIECGKDQYGTNCGTCPYGELCQSGKCVDVPECAGMECGKDQYGFDCGQCAGGKTCQGGKCVEVLGCPPATGKTKGHQIGDTSWKDENGQAIGLHDFCGKTKAILLFKTASW